MPVSLCEGGREGGKHCDVVDALSGDAGWLLEWWAFEILLECLVGVWANTFSAGIDRDGTGVRQRKTVNALTVFMEHIMGQGRVLDCGYSNPGDFLRELVSPLYPCHYQLLTPTDFYSAGYITIQRGEAQIQPNLSKLPPLHLLHSLPLHFPTLLLRASLARNV